MKRIKIPSIASIHLDVFSRRITPAGYPVLLKTQWLKEIFSFITETPAPYNPFIIVTASLPGYNQLKTKVETFSSIVQRKSTMDILRVNMYPFLSGYINIYSIVKQCLNQSVTNNVSITFLAKTY